MKYGFVLPRGDARTAADFAAEAEVAGWDGFFVWEPVWGVDAWVALTAAAMITSHIRLGTMLSPLSRLNPWKLASETATLDQLSGGRVILSVGLGATDCGFEEFGEITDRRLRAERLDEALDLLNLLWKGLPFTYEGKHYQVHLEQAQEKFKAGVLGAAAALQQPRIPIWAVGAWPSKKSMARVKRCDGLLPAVIGEDGKVAMRPATPEEIAAMKASMEGFNGDIVVEGETPGDDLEAAIVKAQAYARAGATWWLESRWDEPDPDRVLTRIRQGPPCK
ncbi:MAG TPA: LLM class flavin-dependent oxidoreductase [Anaerolineaceae bacterium]|nr:LLM class flavin-dependent oxidoreductase [Anaerolineaceae bacterium]HPN50953.1 LLM class flavin-dependent oxidoreductase [Anaerolineaceae bacterium]